MHLIRSTHFSYTLKPNSPWHLVPRANMRSDTVGRMEGGLAVEHQ